MAQRLDVQYIRYYTQGSAAKQVLPAVKQETGVLPQRKKRKVQRIYVDPVAILGATVAVCMLIAMVVGITRLQAAQQKTAAMTAHVEQLQAENTALQAQYDAQCDLEEVKKTALALGMIPSEQATHTAIEVELPTVETEMPTGVWQQIGTFLTGLFA